MKVNYWSDIQWENHEKDSLNVLFDRLLNEEYLILNGDIGDSSEFFEDIMKFIIENKPKGNIIINLGNHDNIEKAIYFKKLLEKEGINNVKIVTYPELIELENKKLLIVPGAHKVSGPGTVAKNAFYYEDKKEDEYYDSLNFENENRKLLPTGYYFVIKNQNGVIYKKVDENILNKYFDLIVENKLEDTVNKLNLYERIKNNLEIIEKEKEHIDSFKKYLNEEGKKEFEKKLEELEKYKEELSKKYKELESELGDIIKYKDKLMEFLVLKENNPLYLHVNSQEIAEKFKNHNLYGIISHDPIKHDKIELGDVEGIEVPKDFDLIYRIEGKEDVYEIKIKLKKGIYNKNFELIPYILSQFQKEISKIKNINFNKAFEEFNRDLDFIIEYHIKKGNLKETIYDVSDPYLNLEAKLAIGGHIERDYLIYDKEGNRLYPNEESDSLYARIHSKDFPQHKHTTYLHLDDKIKIEYKKLNNVDY